LNRLEYAQHMSQVPISQGYRAAAQRVQKQRAGKFSPENDSPSAEAEIDEIESPKLDIVENLMSTGMVKGGNILDIIENI